MRREPGERLGELEVVGELGPGLLFALADPGHQLARGPHPLPQLADEVGVLGELLDQDGAGPLQRGRGVGHPVLGVHVVRRGLLRIPVRLGQQQVASGSSPASRAICALVRRLGLYGR